MKKNRRDTIQTLHGDLRLPSVAKAGWVGASANRAKASANQCVVVFSIAAVLTMMFLQGCAPKGGTNKFNDSPGPSNSAVRLENGTEGQFQASKTVKAEDLSPLDLFSNGCVVIGSSASSSQIDVRLVSGDSFTENFEESTLLGQRKFSLQERIDTNDVNTHILRSVGQVTQLDGTTAEFTRQCAETPATDKVAGSVTCTTSPNVDATLNTAEPCTFVSAGTVSKITLPGTYQDSRGTDLLKTNVYMVKQIDKGDLTCGAKSYRNLKRTQILMTSNEVPTLQPDVCGGATLFKSVLYEDKSKHVIYNSRFELKPRSRFGADSTEQVTVKRTDDIQVSAGRDKTAGIK